MIKYLVHDIETIPETELQSIWEADKEKNAAKGKEYDFEPIWAHKVICIGMLALDHELKPVKGGCAAGGVVGEKSEREMIERWSLVASGKLFNQSESLCLVDWFGTKFDVPVLQTRAFRYGVPLPWLYELLPDNRGGISNWSKEYRDKYHGKHLDVSELWTLRGMFPKPRLLHLAKLMGLPGKLDCDGGKIYDVWKNYAHARNVAEGKTPGPKGTSEQHEAWRVKSVEIAATIDIYCMQDVFETAFLFQRFYYMAGKLTLDQYRAAATSLLDWIAKLPEQKEFLEATDRDAVLLNSALESANADPDNFRDDHIPTGSGSDPAAGEAVLGAADLHTA